MVIYENVQTVFSKKMNVSQRLIFNHDIPDEKEYEFEVQGQNVGMSYEDRNVYFDFSKNPTGWLNAEDAIELGQALIHNDTNAFLSNMINHQLIHVWNQYKKYLNDEVIDYTILEVIDDHPVNYGSGFRTYKVIPVFKDGKSPKYDEDFEFDQVIYWSPFYDEYTKQINMYGGKDKVVFIGYDHDDEARKFRISCGE